MELQLPCCCSSHTILPNTTQVMDSQLIPLHVRSPASSLPGEKAQNALQHVKSDLVSQFTELRAHPSVQLDHVKGKHSLRGKVQVIS